MSTATLERITVADFLARDDQDDYELIDGELKERSKGAKAVWVTTELALFIGAFNRIARLGLLFTDGVTLEIFGGRDYLPRPDGLFISFGRLGSTQPPDGTLTAVPELVVEVVSPSDKAGDVDRKIRRYLHAGVDMVWVAYPDTRAVHVFRRDGTSARVEPPQSLDGENILPGFSHPVADFFPAPVPE